MTEEAKPARHTIGAFKHHPSWEPAPIVLPDDTDIAVFISNASEDTKHRAVKAYTQLYPDGEFTIGPPRDAPIADAKTLAKSGIVGIYGRRKKA